MNIPTIDLFSGAGGLSYGLKSCGLDIRAAVEIDPNAINTYKRNIGDVVIDRDISEISGKELLEFAGIKKGEMFILAGCPPCQGFSSVGPRDETDIRNQLVFQYVRLILETRPWFIIMENVPGMSRGIGKAIFAEVRIILSDYYILNDDILDSANYGVPQHRKRLVMHGVLKTIAEKYLPPGFELQMPEITHKNPEILDESKQDWLTVDVIRDLPFLKAGGDDSDIPNHRCRGLSELNIERIKHTPHNGGSRDSWPEDLILDCHKGNVVYSDVYGRMDFKSQAPTITAGCLIYSKGRFGHPEQDRPISAREAARLQTFPDEFVFEGNLEMVGRQIGNAVPPKLAEASGRHIIEIIKKYDIAKKAKRSKKKE